MRKRYIDKSEIIKRVGERAIFERPEHKIREMLALHKSLPLKDFASTYHIKRASSMKKTEIIDKLIERILGPGFIESIFIFLNDDEIALLEKAIAAGELHVTKKELADAPCRFLLRIFALELYYHAGGYIFVVPDEIAAIYASLQDTDFPATRTHYCHMDLYATALASLYGAIRMDDFIEIFNSQNTDQTEENDVYRILGEFIERGRNRYVTWMDCIVSTEFETQLTEDVLFADVDFDEIEVLEVDEDEVNYGVLEDIYSRQEKIPLKHFSKEEILNYANPGYFEITPAHERLRAYMKQIAPDPEKVVSLEEIILGEIHESALWCGDAYEYTELLGLLGLLTEPAYVKELAALVLEVRNHTRIWGCNGWTLHELVQNGQEEPQILQDMSFEKALELIDISSNALRSDREIHINDLCPCGSGKRYKNCCFRHRDEDLQQT